MTNYEENNPYQPRDRPSIFPSTAGSFTALVGSFQGGSRLLGLRVVGRGYIVADADYYMYYVLTYGLHGALDATCPGAETA